MLIRRCRIVKAIMSVDSSSHYPKVQLLDVFQDIPFPAFPGIGFPFPLHILQSDHNP
jgi:hypothetical protein